MLENTVSLSFTDKRITTQLWQKLYYVNGKKVFGLTKLIYTQIYMTNKVNMHICRLKMGERINKWKYNVNSPIGTVMTYVNQMLLLSSSRHKHSLLTYLQSKRPKRLQQPHILIQLLGPLRWYGGDCDYIRS